MELQATMLVTIFYLAGLALGGVGVFIIEMRFEF